MVVSLPARCDVAIVGGGPVGVLLALLLARLGVDVVLLERAPEVHPLPRAIAADEVVLATLAPLVPDAVAAMLPLRDVRLVDGDGRSLVDVRLPDDRLLGQPPLATFSQPQLEQALRAALSRHPSARLVLGAEVVGVDQAPHRALVHLRDGRALVASFVVACDGAASVTRQALGIGFRGRTAPQLWLVVDLSGGALPGRRGITFTCDPRRPTVDLPSPGGGHRVEGMLHPGEPEEVLTRPDARAALVRHVLGDPAHELAVVRSAVYTFHSRLAHRWRVGRVLLAGDAAHALPPFLGQGLAAGVRDAASLAWRLAEVLDGRAQHRLLDTWETERRGHVRSALVRSRALGALVATASPAGARTRDLVLRTATGTPRLGRWLAEGGPRPPTGTRTPLRGTTGMRGAGQVLPSPRVRWSDAGDGRPERLDALLPAGWLVLGLHGDPLAESSEVTRALWATRGTALVLSGTDSWTSGLQPDLVDRDGTVVRLLAAAHPSGVAVVRPDRLLVGVVAPARLDALTARLARRAGWTTGATSAGDGPP